MIIAFELETLKQASELRRDVDERGAAVFTETALAIQSSDACPAHDIVATFRALLRPHFQGQERETDATRQQLLQQSYFTFFLFD